MSVDGHHPTHSPHGEFRICRVIADVSAFISGGHDDDWAALGTAPSSDDTVVLQRAPSGAAGGVSFYLVQKDSDGKVLARGSTTFDAQIVRVRSYELAEGVVERYAVDGTALGQLPANRIGEDQAAGVGEVTIRITNIQNPHASVQSAEVHIREIGG